MSTEVLQDFSLNIWENLTSIYLSQNLIEYLFIKSEISPILYFEYFLSLKIMYCLA